MQLSKDFADFVELLNEHQVEYMVVGGYALAFHGKPRYTGDIDIWINISDTNARKMMRVIDDFGLASLGLQKEDFMKEKGIIQIGYPPLRIDILNSIDGVDFKTAMTNHKVIKIKDLKISFIGINEFIQNKLASGRPQDLTDIKGLK
jgi:hypothetical protein